MHILFALDSFKGTLSSKEAGDIVSKAFMKQLDITHETYALADGGEGTLDTLVENNKGTVVKKRVSDPFGRPVEARYGLLKDNSAVIEMAEAAGLARLDEGEADPLRASSRGVGELICDALDKGIRKFIVGIGGSATNDMGMGLLHALGYRFLDQRGQVMSPSGESMAHVASIDRSGVHPALEKAQFSVACDVLNPLYGNEGAAHVFAPQKGADKKTVDVLDEGLRHLSRMAALHTGAKENLPRDGAAGGLGAGLRMFLGADLRSGFEVVYETSGIGAALKKADMVVTGEGKIDKQTLMEKAPYGLAKKAQASGVRVIALAGRVDMPSDMREDTPFDIMMGTFEGDTGNQAVPSREKAKENLIALASRAAKLLQAKKL